METAAGFQTAGFIETGGKTAGAGAQTLYFEHEKSGASLFISEIKIQTGDSRFLLTPHLDETDTNHV